MTDALARKLYGFLNRLDILLGLECGDKKINQPSLSYLLVYTSYLFGLRAGLFFQSQAPRERVALMPILLQLKIWVVMQYNVTHQSRKTTTQKGKIIGDCDKLVTWYKPKKCPQGLSESDFLTLPSTLSVREIYYYIIIPGFRTQRVSLITTLLDTTIYSTLEVLKLYGELGDVEINLKHLKTTCLNGDIAR